MDGTILCQGSFTARYSQANPNPGNAETQAGDAVVIQIPSGVDWLKVYNYTKAGQNGNSAAYFQGVANANVGYEFYWQRGMAPGTGMVRYKANGAATVDQETFNLVSVAGGGGGFTLYDPSGQDPQALPVFGPSVAFSAISNATQPVVTTASTAGLFVGAVVRLALQSGDTALANDVSGIDFIVSAITTNTSFTLLASSNALANVPGLTTGTGHWRLVNYYPMFYPRRLYVTNITQAVNATVSTAIAHGLTPGQEVRFLIPAVSGMVQLNSTQQSRFLAATILTVVDDYSFTINVDTTFYTAFSWPTVAQMPSSFPEVVPVGEDTATSLTSVANQVPSINGLQIYNTNSGLLADSTVNTGFLGMILGSGGRGITLTTPIIGPAGTVHFSSGDVIDARDTVYWVAGKSSFGGL